MQRNFFTIEFLLKWGLHEYKRIHDACVDYHTDPDQKSGSEIRITDPESLMSKWALEEPKMAGGREESSKCLSSSDEEGLRHANKFGSDDSAADEKIDDNEESNQIHNKFSAEYDRIMWIKTVKNHPLPDYLLPISPKTRKHSPSIGIFVDRDNLVGSTSPTLDISTHFRAEEGFGEALQLMPQDQQHSTPYSVNVTSWFSTEKIPNDAQREQPVNKRIVLPVVRIRRVEPPTQTDVPPDPLPKRLRVMEDIAGGSSQYVSTAVEKHTMTKNVKDVVTERMKVAITKQLCFKTSDDGVEQYQCLACKKTFNISNDLNFHIVSVHANKKNFHCVECGFLSLELDVIIRHMREHSGESMYKCSYCDFTVKHCMKLIGHMRKHHSIVPYQLQLCKELIDQNKILTVEKSTPQGKLPPTSRESKSSRGPSPKTVKVECSMCNKLYNGEHFNTHLKKSKFQCPNCPYAIAQLCRMKDHMMNVHNMEMYRCKHCNQIFTDVQEFISHETEEHGYKHICNQCGEAYASHHGLWKHKSKCKPSAEKNPADVEVSCDDLHSQINNETQCHQSEIQANEIELIPMKQEMIEPSFMQVLEVIRDPSMTETYSLDDPSQIFRFLEVFIEQTAVSSQFETPEFGLEMKSLTYWDYQCTKCGETFNGSEQLLEHVLFVHPNKDIFYCIVCNFIGYLDDITAHVHHHPGELQYHYFTDSDETEVAKHEDDHINTIHVLLSSSLRVHYETRFKYKCHYEDCTLAFEYFKNLQMHVENHGVKISKCQFCETILEIQKMRWHKMTQHSDKFHCGICDYSANNQKRWSTHMRQKHNISSAYRKLKKSLGVLPGTKVTVLVPVDLFQTVEFPGAGNENASGTTDEPENDKN